MSGRYKEFIEVLIESDEMSADIYLKPVADPSFYNTKEIIEYLSENGVVSGISSEEVDNMVKSMFFGRFVTVAKGVGPVDGRDGYYDFKFDIKPTKTPKLNEDGSVDYKNLGLLQVVEAGQEIAEYHFKKDGIPGFTVKGTVLDCKNGKDLPPLRGKGFSISEDGSKYISDQNGKIELNLGHVIIRDICTISKDVDLETGNIDFRGDVEISGSVRTGMVVKTTGAVVINGLVEGAVIEAGKDILIKGGILGGGKARIISGGNIFAQFIENAYVRSDDCVQADSIINSDVLAYNDINVFGKTSKIVGGKLKANRCIRTRILGSDAGIKTYVEVGIDLKSYNVHKTYGDEIIHLEEELEKVEKLIEMLSDSESKDNSKLHMTALRTKIELSAEISKKGPCMRK